MLLVAFFLGTQLLRWKPLLLVLFSQIVGVGWLVQTGLWATGALTAYMSLRRRRRMKRAPAEVTTIDFAGLALRAAIWTIVVLAALHRLGINVSAVVTGLGIGGIVVALAAQSVLKDLLASLSILLDRPFGVGDVLGVDEFRGSVEKVALKTTRMRSRPDGQLILSNTDLLASRIRNFGRMTERRVAFTVGIRSRLLRAVADTAVFMDIQERIDLRVFVGFAEHGIRFAYPTQTLYLAETHGPPESPALQGPEAAEYYAPAPARPRRPAAVDD